MILTILHYFFSESNNIDNPIRKPLAEKHFANTVCVVLATSETCTLTWANFMADTKESRVSGPIFRVFRSSICVLAVKKLDLEPLEKIENFEPLYLRNESNESVRY